MSSVKINFTYLAETPFSSVNPSHAEESSFIVSITNPPTSVQADPSDETDTSTEVGGSIPDPFAAAKCPRKLYIPSLTLPRSITTVPTPFTALPVSLRQ